MHTPPSGDPRWRELTAPVLDLLRSLPGGADWPALRAWMRSARWTITRVTNALAWLEGEGLARSAGGREVVPGLDCAVPGRARAREARAGVDEPVRWHATAAPAEAPQRPDAAPFPVVRGPAPPAALPPLRGPFLTGRPASPPALVQRADPGSRDPGSRADGPLRLPSEDRALREEACAPRVWRGGSVRRSLALGTGEPAAPPLGPSIPPEALREVRKARQRDSEAARRERERTLKAALPPVDLPRPGIGTNNAKKRDERRAARRAWLAAGPTCSECGAPFTAVPAFGYLPKKCATCRRGRPKPERHPPCCGCAECG